MDYTVWTVVAAMIAFVAGILCQRFLFSDGTEKLKLSNQLKNLRREYHEYQTKVSDHLQHTSRLINTIQSHYDEVQSHLLSAAQDLNPNEARQSLLQPHSHYITYGDDAEEQEQEEGEIQEDHPLQYPHPGEFFNKVKTQEGRMPPKDYV